ncbi:Sugar and other transporter [Aspergillus sclerotialis]|uniref:Sugar and other transporter n=1 Tax=Aspergillus sclerotialis TaxID=2070753 RepID=A0A3A2ZC67_9EURO|nr:Sugar and other transporter [Aspergillus sclerotialis]
MAPYFGLRGSSLTIAISIIAATGFGLQGYDQTVANGLLTLPTFLHTFPETKDSTIQGTTVAIYEVGCAIGALTCAFVGDIFGRTRTIFSAGCIVLIGIILESTSFDLPQLIVSRVICGLGVGAFTATIPMYVSESVNARKRGRLVLTQGFFAVGGIVLASWIEFGLYFLPNNPVNWRFPFAFQAVFALIATIFILFMPESPRWLVKRDRLDDARTIVGCLEDQPEDSDTVAHEMNIMLETFAEEQRSSANVFSMGPERLFHRAVLAVLVNTLAQMSGVNIVTFYSTTILEEHLGYSGTISRVVTGCIQIWQFLSAGLAILIIDRFGRRKLLMMGAAGLCIAQTGLAGCTSHLSSTSVSGAAIFFYFVAMFCFPIGLFLLPFMYAAEIAPLPIRAKVAAAASCANWLFNFLVAEVTPTATANIGYRYYIVYAVINFTSFFVFYFFYPETKGRTLEEIDNIFIQSKNIFDPVRIEKNMPKGELQVADTEKAVAIEVEERA